MKYYIIAGEASGDLHGGNLLKELHQVDNQAIVRCWGGELMQMAGAELVKHYEDLAFMGFVEVIKNLPTIFKNLQFCKEDILQFSPDVVILIDYPGFNLRIAEFAKAQGYTVFYYISPKVWAWNTSRIKKMKKNIDHLFSILPFETPFFEKHNWDKVTFVGNPLLDAIQQRQKRLVNIQPTDLGLSMDKPIIALLPGSRKQEIKRMLPIMLSMVNKFPDYQFVVSIAPSFSLAYYEPFIPDFLPIYFVKDATYELVHLATAALVTSGTATLETALLGTPQVVCYKTNELTYQIAKRVVDLKYISLVNLILDDEGVKELIQHELNEVNLYEQLQAILPTGSKHEAMLAAYKQLQMILGNGGASAKAAQKMRELLTITQH